MAYETRTAEHNLVASFSDMTAARSAIGALEDAGIDASRISLLGQQAAEAANDTDTAGRDERVMDEHAGTAVSGILAGALIAAAIGFGVGLLMFGSGNWGAVWAMVLGGAAAGAGVGLAVTSYARIKQSEAWETTYDTVSGGEVLVGVHTPDQAELRSAAGVLREFGGRNLHHTDAAGRDQPLD